MGIGDHQLDAAQAASGERAKELDPERFGLTVADRHAQHFAPAVAVDADGNNDSNRDDAVIAPSFDIGGIEPDIGPLAFYRPVQEGLNPLVDLAAQPRDLTLADPLQIVSRGVV
jgi:hypothetical protein